MAKKVIRDERLNLDIVIEGNKGQMELGKLEGEARKLNQQIKDMGVEIGKTKNKDSDAYKTMVANRKELSQQLNINKEKQTALRKELGLHGLTYKQLGQEARRLQLLLSNSTYGSEQWKKLDAELRRVKGRMHEVRGGAMQTGFSLSKMATGFNKYFMIVSTFALSISGIVMGIRKAYLAFAEFDDKIADVMKTTGLTKDEVKELNKELEKIDTRSSQEDLLNLSRIAGKLGINAKEDVLGFVRAADKINVALSEDLGGGAEEAIRELGKLTDIFKLKDVYGIEESLLKIGSTINALGAASTANEPYLVEFTKRLAGIAPSVNISIQNVLGLAASLDQLGQTSEVSSTVMSQMIPKMFKDTATFANIARMSLSDFSKLLKEDTNEALLRVLEGLKGNSGGFEELVKSLGDIGLEGKRTISVLGVLANNTDLIREQQVFANDEFEKGTSILNEFNVKNETARAGLDKAVKSIKTTTRELGEKLSPAIRGVVSGGTMLIRGLSTMVDFFVRYGKEIKLAIIFLTTFIGVKKLDLYYTGLLTKARAAETTIWGLFTTKVKQATASMQTFNIISKGNVFGLVVSAITAAISAFMIFNRQIKNASKMQKEFNKIQEDAKKAVDEFGEKLGNEVGEMNSLFASLKSANKESETRSYLIKEINDKYGQYLPKLLTEKSTLKEVEEAYKLVNKQLIAKIALEQQNIEITSAAQIAMKKMVHATDTVGKLVRKDIGEVNTIFKAWASGKLKEDGVDPFTLLGIKEGSPEIITEVRNQLTYYINALNISEHETERIARKYKAFIVDLKKDLQGGVNLGGGDDGGDGDGDGDGDGGDGDKTKNKLDKLKAEAEKIKDAWEKLYDELALIEMTEYQKSVELLRREMEVKKETIEKAYSTVDPVTKKRIISEQEKNDALLILDQDYVAATWLLAQKELERWQKGNDEQFLNAKETEEKIQALREQYGLIEQAELLKKQLDELDAFYVNGLMKEEDYQKARAQIIKKYAQLSVIDREKLVGKEAADNLQKWYDTELAALQDLNTRKLLNDEQYQQAKTELERTHTEYRKELQQQAVTASLDTFSNMFGVLASMFEEGSTWYKAFAIFQVTIDTVKAAMSAYNSMIGIPYVGPILAPIAAAAAAAFGIAQIVKISNMEVPQHYQGYYDVLGEQTGKKYQAKYKGKPTTGYVSSPSLYLAGDDPHRLKEMIISGPDLKNPMIADYARAIMDIKYGKQIPYVTSQQPNTTPSVINNSSNDSLPLLKDINDNLSDMNKKLDNPTRSYIVYSELEAVSKKVQRIEEDVSRLYDTSPVASLLKK